MSDLIFDDIRSIGTDAWKKQIEQDLKGITAEQLSKKDRDGILISPFYNHEHSISTPRHIVEHNNWKSGALLNEAESETQNKNALRTLSNGADSITFSIDDKTDPSILLNEIQHDIVEINFQFRDRAPDFCQRLFDTLQKKNNLKLNGYLLLDPISLFVKGYHTDHEKRFDFWSRQCKHELFKQTELSPYAINGSIYQNAGCSPATELSLILSHLNEMLDRISSDNLPLKDKAIHIIVTSSTRYFENVAKLRALRVLVKHVLKEYPLENEIRIHTFSSLLDKTAADAYNNLIRTTLEGMGSIAGGSNTIHLIPYDFVGNKSDTESSRLAINQLLIFKEEAFLNVVADIAAGSFFVETYTDELIQLAWTKFKQWEDKGGLIVLSESGELKQIVDTEANELKKEYVSGKRILVGVNKFRNEKETKAERKFQASTLEKGIAPVFAEEWINMAT